MGNKNNDQTYLAKVELLLICIRQVAAYDWQLHVLAWD